MEDIEDIVDDLNSYDMTNKTYEAIREIIANDRKYQTKCLFNLRSILDDYKKKNDEKMIKLYTKIVTKYEKEILRRRS